jgi:hemerythrin superfamily protein
MALLKALANDHRYIRRLLDAVLDAKEAHKIADAFSLFAAELSARSRAEEEALYHHLENTKAGKAKALVWIVEHRIMDRLMEDLGENPMDSSDTWMACGRALRKFLENHFDEEEHELFDAVRLLFGAQELAKMDEEFHAHKSVRRLPPPSLPVEFALAKQRPDIRSTNGTGRSVKRA